LCCSKSTNEWRPCPYASRSPANRSC
jgi:hypothetical protein